MMCFFLHTRCRGSILALFSGYLHFHFALAACTKLLAFLRMLSRQNLWAKAELPLEGIFFRTGNF